MNWINPGEVWYINQLNATFDSVKTPIQIQHEIVIILQVVVPRYAVPYPSLAVDSRGDVAIVFLRPTGTLARAVVWPSIMDLLLNRKIAEIVVQRSDAP